MITHCGCHSHQAIKILLLAFGILSSKYIVSTNTWHKKGNWNNGNGQQKTALLSLGPKQSVQAQSEFFSGAGM